MHTLTEENYLKAIYRIFESTGETVSTNAIAENLADQCRFSNGYV